MFRPPPPSLIHFIEFTCEGSRCPVHHFPYGRSEPGVASYCGYNYDECHRAARAAGWTAPHGLSHGYYCLSCVPVQASC